MTCFLKKMHNTILRLDMPRFSWADTRMSEDMENFAEDGCVMWELALTSKKQSRKKNNAKNCY